MGSFSLAGGGVCIQPIRKKHYFERTRGSRRTSCIEIISFVVVLEGVCWGIPFALLEHVICATELWRSKGWPRLILCSLPSLVKTESMAVEMRCTATSWRTSLSVINNLRRPRDSATAWGKWVLYSVLLDIRYFTYSIYILCMYKRKFKSFLFCNCHSPTGT